MGGGVGSPGHAARRPISHRSRANRGSGRRELPRGETGAISYPQTPASVRKGKIKRRQQVGGADPAARACWPPAPAEPRGSIAGTRRSVPDPPSRRSALPPGLRLPSGERLPGSRPRPPALPAAAARALTAAFLVGAQLVLGEAPARAGPRLARAPPGQPEQEQPQGQPRRRSHVVVPREPATRGRSRGWRRRAGPGAGLGRRAGGCAPRGGAGAGSSGSRLTRQRGLGTGDGGVGPGTALRPSLPARPRLP